jgi:hypothetical protein
MLDHLARDAFSGASARVASGDFEVVGIDPRSGARRQISIEIVDAVWHCGRTRARAVRDQ